MKKASKLIALLLSLMLVVGLLAACGGGGTPTDASTPATGDGGDAPAEGDGGDAEGLNLSVNLASEPETIDPQQNSAVDGAVMAHHFFEGLMRWADDGSGMEDGTGNAKLVEGAAVSYEKGTNDAGEITYTFKMREGATWSDGTPVTANDFEWSWKHMADPATGAYYAYMIDGIIKGATEIMSPDEGSDPEEPTFENAADPDTLGVTAIDESTLEVVLVSDCPYFLELCAFPTLFPVRQDIIEAHGDQWTFSPDTYIGNGPYKLTEWEHNSYIHSVKSETYWDYANLGPESIRYVLMDDNNAMLAGFNSGELDFIENMPVDEIPALKESGELKIIEYIGTRYVSFNVQAAPFDDARVREAFTLVIDRNNLADNIIRTGEMPAGAFVPVGIADATEGSAFRDAGDYYSVDPAEYEANCERARELMAEAGYPDGAGFPAVEYMYNTDDLHKQMGEAMQADWQRELGVSVTLNNQDWSVFLQSRKEGNFQIARDGWISDFNDPISFLDMYVSTSGNNNAQLRSPEFDEIIARSRAAAGDPAERMKILHEAEDYLMDNYIVGPMTYYTNKYMFNPDVQGLYYTPLGYFLFDRCTKVA